MKRENHQNRSLIARLRSIVSSLLHAPSLCKCHIKSSQNRLLPVVLITIALFATSTAQEITVFGNQEKRPKIWKENHISQGILVDILRAVEKDLDVVFSVTTFPWKRSYEYALEGKGAIVGLSKTKERMELFDYSIPLFYDEVILVVKKGKEFPFNTLRDLEGKVIGACGGCSFGDEYEMAKNYFILDEDYSNQGRLKKVLLGRIDAAIISPGSYAFYEICNNDPNLNEDDFTIISKPLVRDPNHLAFHKELNQKEFLLRFNAILQEKITSGEIQDIIDTYIIPEPKK